MTAGERRAARKMALGLGLDTDGHLLTEAALFVLTRPWRLEESTAQPPVNCTHAARHLTRNGLQCSVCGEVLR